MMVARKGVAEPVGPVGGTHDQQNEVSVDVRKAFDTVNHNILLKKLEHYGIQGVVLQWFNSYLSGRHQCTKVNGKVSNNNGLGWLTF